MSRPLCLRNCRLALDPGRLVNVILAKGRIQSILPVGSDQPEEQHQVDLSGALLLPSFIDAHVHLDKTRFGLPRLHHPVTASVADRAANERCLRRETNHDPLACGERLLRHLAIQGTTHLRSHVDVDDGIGLNHVRAMLELRERVSGWMDIQLVAFPQSGILRSPGTAELLAEALRMGVDLVGGLDPELIDGNRDAHLDVVFSLAERFGAGIDLHVHEGAVTGLDTIRAVADRAAALGMRGKVCLSHAYALGQNPESEVVPVLESLADQEITVLTSAPGATAFPPVPLLHRHGVRYCAMSDNIQDFWSPWGTGDQLERAMQVAIRHNFRADAPIVHCLDMVASAPAALFGLAGHGPDIKPGMAANLTALMAEDAVAAMVTRPPRLLTVKDGRLIARDGVCLIATE